MKKNTTNKYFGPKEMQVVARLAYEKQSLITKEQFDKWFGFNEALRKQVIFRLKKKGVLVAIKRGVYFYSPLESGPAGSNINEFLIPQVFFPKGNYYVGYSTMYNYYGFSDQLFQVMYILNTSLQREKTIGGIRFKMVKISPERLYGTRKIRVKNAEVVVSDRERTLVDLIYYAGPVGGMKRAFEILEEDVRGNRTDTAKLIKYTLEFPNISTVKRIGFILEKVALSERKLMPLLKFVKRTSLIGLYPSKSRKGKINKRWMVIENAA